MAVDVTVASVENAGDAISYPGYAEAGIAYLRGDNQLTATKLITTTVGLGLSNTVLKSNVFSTVEKVGINAWIDGPKTIIDKCLSKK